MGSDVAVVWNVGSATFGILRPVLVATLPEGRGGFRESAEKVYQDVAWYGVLTMKRDWVNWGCSPWKDGE